MVVLGPVGLLTVRSWSPVEFQFTPIADLPGFRRIEAGDASRGLDPLFGLDRPGPEEEAAIAGQLRRDLGHALFGDHPLEAGTVPIASFSDYSCPYCRVLTRMLSVLEEEAGGGIRVSWHEWPILGKPSVRAAEAALAAKQQDAYQLLHRRLMATSFVPTPSYLHAVADELGLDADRLLADMGSAEVTGQIAESRALADLFGFAGTPALVVGRTAVQGAIDEATLRALIERERADGPVEFPEIAH